MRQAWPNIKFRQREVHRTAEAVRSSPAFYGRPSPPFFVGQSFAPALAHDAEVVVTSPHRRFQRHHARFGCAAKAQHVVLCPTDAMGPQAAVGAAPDLVRDPGVVRGEPKAVWQSSPSTATRVPHCSRLDHKSALIDLGPIQGAGCISGWPEEKRLLH